MAYLERTLVREDADFVPPPDGGAERSDRDDKFMIESRFGSIEVDPKSIVHFRSGLLGFGDAKEFVLIDLDNPKFKNFRVLQCVTEPDLAFIVFPPSLDGGLIERADIEAAAEAVHFPKDDLIVLLLVTVRRGAETSTLSVNLRAPVLIDPARFVGVQYVMPNDKYPVRFSL